ncbi:MAG: YajG family lipoprotein, partial [Chlamydiota bacterium]
MQTPNNLFFLLLIFLAGCSYMPERISLAYVPLQHSLKMDPPSDTRVSVYVVDNRRNGKTVSYKKGDHNVERASIQLSCNLSEEITDAVTLELHNRGFNTEKGSTQIHIEIQKFYNEFKEAFLGSRGVSELILSVTVAKSSDNIYYSKMIIGIGENDSVWIHSGNNAARALNRA